MDGIDGKPQKFTDCARMFNDCKDAEKYNNYDEEENVDEETTNNDYKNEASTVNDSEGAATEPNTLDKDSANEVRRMRQYYDDVAQFVHSDRSTMQ